MTKLTLSRRSVLKAGASAAAFATLGAPAIAQSDVRLRMFWWGAKERADRTEKVNSLFQQKNPGTTVSGETLGWTDYWPRLATQAGGRNAPDVIQMDYRYIFEYARRGALLPLDQFIPGKINVGDFSKEAIDSGKVDGKIYGLSLGLNSVATMYDKQLIESLGLKPPTWDMTWAQYGDLATEITKAAKKTGYSGITDGGRYEPALDCWMRQHGRQLYTDDGKLGFGESEIAEWFEFWDKLRKRGGAASPEVQALDNGEIDTSLMTQGKTAIVFANSNQLVGFQALSKNKLGMTMYPAGGPGMKPGQYLKPSMLISIYARTPQPEAAAKLVDFYVSNQEAALLLSVERGVPASAAVRKVLEPTLDELGKVSAQYVSFISDKVGPLPPPPPQGAGEIQMVLRRVNEQIGFGRMTVAAGAKQFINEANAALARS